MTLSRMVSHGSRVGFWNAMPTRIASAPTSRPATNTRPLVLRMSPLTSLRMVDLPQPDGPTSATKSPFTMRRLVGASAFTARSPPP